MFLEATAVVVLSFIHPTRLQLPVLTLPEVILVVTRSHDYTRLCSVYVPLNLSLKVTLGWNSSLRL